VGILPEISAWHGLGGTINKSVPEMADGSRGSGFAGERKAWHSGLQRGAAEQVG